LLLFLIPLYDTCTVSMISEIMYLPTVFVGICLELINYYSSH